MMSSVHDSRFSGLTPKLAWSIAVATAFGAVVASLLPGRWASEAFVLLRFAAIFYGLTSTYCFLRTWARESASGAPETASGVNAGTSAPSPMS
jgi:hypothetical protein